MIASALGARVVAVDVAAGALSLASELGAAKSVAGGVGVDVAEAVVAATGGGAHVSIDALGSAVTAVNSVRCLRRRGRHVQVGLLLGPAATPPIPMDEVIPRELEIYGSHGMPARDYPAMMSMIADGRLSPAKLLGRVIGLDEAGAALAALDGTPPTVGITVVDLGR
jgi:alcohol dehydrogenase